MPDRDCPDSPVAPARGGESRGALKALDLDRRRQWEAALARCEALPVELCRDHIATPMAQSRREMTLRLVQAMLLEGVLTADSRGDGVARVPIPRPGDEGAALLIEGLENDRATFFPQLRLLHCDSQGRRLSVEDPIDFLDLVAPVVQGASAPDLQRFACEVIDATLNDALCRAYRSSWNDRLRQSVQAAGESGFWDWLKQQPDARRRRVMLEQWSATGHPCHPTHKTRLGMTPAEVLACCPEFEPEVAVGLAAARRELTHGETLPGTAPREHWLESHFPAQAEAWHEALAAQGLEPADYVPLPVHPWQAYHEIPRRFARSLAGGDLVLLPGPTIACAPLVSVRTLVPATPAGAPDLKLSFGVRLTSTERTISPRSCEMGPRISRLLQELIRTDSVLASSLRILPEEAGMYFASEDPDERAEARHLAALLRRSPAGLCADGDVVVPATALTATSPTSRAPLFLEIAASGGRTGPDQIRDVFAHYVEAFLRPLVTLFLHYGIALEAHQQNTLAVYSHGGALQGFIFRDFGGIRIDEGSLRRAGLNLEVHPDRLTVVDGLAAARRKLTSHALLRHLGFLFSRVSRFLQTSEDAYWSIVADVMDALLNDLRGDVAAAVWQRERAALLDEPWDLKANLRMRFEDISHDVYVETRNPLRRSSRPRDRGLS